MSDNIERNYFTHLAGTAPPWHGKVYRTHNGQWEDFLAAAQMGDNSDFLRKEAFAVRNWTAMMQEIRNLAAKDPSLSGLEDCIKRQLIQSEGYRMAVRKFDSLAFPISDTFKIHQPRQILEVARRLYDAGGLTLDTAFWLGRGSMIVFSAKVNGDFEVRGPKGNIVNHCRLNGVTGMMGQRATEFFTSATTIVCANTLRIAEMESKKAGGPKAKFSHRSDFSEISVKQAVELVSMSTSAMERHRQAMEWLRSIKLKDPLETLRFTAELTAGKEILRFIAEVEEETKPGSILDVIINEATSSSLASDIHKRLEKATTPKERAIINAIIDSPGCDGGDNYFSLVQGATYTATHTKFRKGDADSFLTSVVVGPRAQWGPDAVKIATRMASQAQ